MSISFRWILILRQIEPSSSSRSSLFSEEGILVVTVAAAVVVVVAWEAGGVRGRVCVGVGGAAAVVSSGVSAACWRPPSVVRRAVRVLVLSSGALVAWQRARQQPPV
jgi:hypothetical protein